MRNITPNESETISGGYSPRLQPSYYAPNPFIPRDQLTEVIVSGKQIITTSVDFLFWYGGYYPDSVSPDSVSDGGGGTGGAGGGSDYDTQHDLTHRIETAQGQIAVIDGTLHRLEKANPNASLALRDGHTISIGDLRHGLEELSKKLNYLQAGSIAIEAINGDPVIAKAAGFLAGLAVEAGVAAAATPAGWPFLAGLAASLLTEKGVEYLEAKFQQEIQDYAVKWNDHMQNQIENYNSLPKGLQFQQMLQEIFGAPTIPNLKYKYIIDP